MKRSLQGLRACNGAKAHRSSREKSLSSQKKNTVAAIGAPSANQDTASHRPFPNSADASPPALRVARRSGPAKIVARLRRGGVTMSALVREPGAHRTAWRELGSP